MRKILILVATAIFLYSPCGPSWGQFAVNLVLVLCLFSFYSKGHPKRRFYDEEEDYN